MTLVHVMFLSYTSTNRHLPSLTGGSRGADSPPFASTMKVLRLPSSVSLPSVSLGLDTTSPLPVFLSPSIRQRRDERPGPLVYRLSLTPVVSSGDVRLSQVPMETSASLPCSQTPAVMPTTHRTNAAALLLPLRLTTKASAKRNISGLNNTAFPLPVYASCRPLDRLRKTRFRLLVKLCRVGLSHRFPSKGFKERLPIPLSWA